MTDKSIKNGDDEYQFPHDEYVTAEDAQPNDEAPQEEEAVTEEAETVEATASPSLVERFPILQNKRVLMVVGIAVIALVGFKLMTPSHQSMTVKPTQPTAQERQASLQQKQQNVVMNTLNHLSEDASSSHNVVSQLRTQVSALKTSLDKADASNAAMGRAMMVLAEQVKNLSVEVKKATTLPNHIKKLPPSPVLSYHLRAIIPGRAWVTGSNGEADSVTVGSKLKDYGTVKAIDVNAGKVMTSSGKVIAYNASGD